MYEITQTKTADNSPKTADSARSAAIHPPTVAPVEKREKSLNAQSGALRDGKRYKCRRTVSRTILNETATAAPKAEPAASLSAAAFFLP